MESFRISFINLFWLYLRFSEDHGGRCSDTVWQLPEPTISHLDAVSDKQSLVVSWLLNHSSSAGGINEIQISRTEDHVIIYNKNVSARSVGSHGYQWTWTSDLPLECVDHFVRVRHFDNRSVPSPWSKWKANSGAKAKKITMFPLDRMLKDGSNATFCCVPPAGVNITRITLSDQEYPLISIGARVKAIAVENLRFPTNTFKFLKLNCSASTGISRAVVNFVSFPPQKPRNLSCATSSMTTVTCTWDPGRKQHPHDRNKRTYTLHVENTDLAPIKCQTWSCTFPSIPHLNEYNVTVVVKDKLGEEAESYSFNISDRVFPVAEWDSVSPGVTDANMSWIIQGNLTQLLCQLTVNTKATTVLNCSGINGPCKVKVEHLLPSTHYSTRVRCSANGMLWGNWTQPEPFTTYPLVTLNLWRKIKQLSYPYTRQVTLLWKMDASGSATTETAKAYTVQWWPEGKNKTVWTDGGQTQAEVSIGPQQCDFTVKAVLHAGSSIPAHITIPKLDDRENLPEEKRLSSGSAAGFNLSWSEWDEPTCGYTVEWCILGDPVSPLQWKHIPEGNNTLLLPAGAVPSPSLVEPVQTTSSSVTLEWRYSEDDPSHVAFITGYLVSVKEVGPNMLPCHSTAMDVFNVSVADPRRKSVTVEGLKQSQEYTFCVSALTKNGPGQPTSITITTRTNYSAQLVKILTFTLFLLSCIILLWCQRKLLKRRLTEVFVYPAGMSIKTPELISFLQQTGERVPSHKMEECITCDIEILNSHRPLLKPSTLRDPVFMSTQFSDSSLSPLCVVPVKDYCPHSVTPPCERPALQQITCMTNRSYFYPMVDESSQTRGEMTSSEVKPSFDLSDGQQSSCTVTYGYVSNDTL
ncbi:leukemia inhibitory factor receptor-like isoform X2 [Solea senegalensis]|uniref:Leukemia inhibitory factor receptor-like isoform X2 n=1 Tax=Solea senegalensis TaxID=28829 RepID=A0AAV6QFF6_SOLSE|nr:oncostatin-M-specific receptor subunit beta isoform X2 [Solea senegalensis]KAG7489235.1 leukemia inhibitory factor receptor-like isoform X2 [Solea senegalensis]